MLCNLFSQERIGDDVVTADQAGQVEGFGRSIESDRTLAGVFGDGCRRDVAVTLKMISDQISSLMTQTSYF